MGPGRDLVDDPKGDCAVQHGMLTLDESTNPVVYKTASLVAESWRALGLQVQLDAVSASSYISRLDSGDYSAAIVVSMLVWIRTWSRF